jgi:hypothetical protein
MSDFSAKLCRTVARKSGVPHRRGAGDTHRNRRTIAPAPPSRWPKSVWRPRSRGIRTSSGRTGIGRICAVRQTMGEGDCIVKQLAVAPYCRAGLTELWLSDSPPASNVAFVSTQAHK